LEKRITFAVDNAELIGESKDSKFSIISLDFFASGPNHHDTYVSEDTLFKTAETIKNCPVVWKYDPMFDDIGSHDPKETPCGFIPESSEITSRKLEDGRTMLSVISYVWRKYSGRFLEFFKRDGDKPVSVEMRVYETQGRKDGLEELLNYEFECVTVLGSLVTPAISLAKATVLQFAKEYEEDYEKEFSNKYSELDLSIPESIKQNANKALSLYEDCGNGVNSVVLAASRFISKNSVATPEKIRQIHKLLNNYSKKDLSEKTPPSSEYISYLALGGSEGHKWSSDLVEQIDEIDARKLSYFNASQDDNEKKEVETFMEDEKDKQEEVKEEENKEEMAVDESKKENEKDEKTEEMAAENNKEEKKEEDKEEEKSFDFAELLNAFKEETEEFQAFAAEIAKPETERNYSKAIAYMYSKMSAMKENCAKMSADKEDVEKKFAQAEEENKTYMAENESLKKFKADIEGQRFQFSIEATIEAALKKVPNMPKEEIDALREESKKYSMDNVDVWKNLVNAKFFTFADGKEVKEDDGIMRFALPWNNAQRENKSPLWD
jgi:hypothetical protein